MSSAQRLTDEWVTPQQLADEMKIELTALYRAHSEGRGPKRFKVGRHIRYLRRDVIEWQQSLAVED